MAEIACIAEMVRVCEGLGRNRRCRDEQRFTNPGTRRTITLTLAGDGVTLNGQDARRYGRDCVREREGLYGFCFSTNRGASMPVRPGGPFDGGAR